MKFFKKYFDSYWIPFAFYIIVLLAGMLCGMVFRSMYLVLVMQAVNMFFFAGMIAASIWNFRKKRWKKGISNLIFPLLNFGMIFIVLSMFGHSGDKFADNLVIPDNIDIAEPGNWNNSPESKEQDAYQKDILDALNIAGSDDVLIRANLPSLIKLNQNAPDIFKRYLAVSPAWRLYQERGKLFATRRWMIGSQWRYTLHGYYTRFELFDKDMPDFQNRFCIGFSGKPWHEASRTTFLKEGQSAKLILSKGNQMNESHCVINADSLFVEVFEQSKFKERRLTKSALAYLEKELNPLLEQPTWGKIKELIPANSIKNSEPSINLWGSGGIYDSEIWVNPGEPGMIYLKAFEVTKNTRLSAEELKESSNEWIGWSEDYNEVFFSNTNFMIYEGDWSKPYAARFEVWFVPDSKAPERKLMERVFKIEGWQR
ncbi:MAG: hypothetical protein HY810_01055 [Candidatus Omnitrophica bacterium]|nr:hypothetical protein [Candidatus Omnitrophota bacterium]